MPSSTSPTSLDLEGGFRLGEVLVRPHASTLEVTGELRRVDYKAMQVLLCLARDAGREVTKERILSRVWDGGAVSDDVLTGAVSTLRRALGDDPRSPRFIQTIPRVGYRLIAPLRASEPSLPTRAAGDVSARRRLVPVLGLVAAILILALVLALVDRWTQRLDRGSPERPEIRSLVVLPLANFTGDDARQHLADGMTEALIAALAKTPDLKVISRTSAMRYKETELNVPEIGHELRVDGVVEGSVQSSADRVHITVQLIDVATDHHLWAESYEAPLTEVLALQSLVAGAISQQLRPTGRASTSTSRVAVASIDPLAYEGYLRGRYLAQASDEADTWTTAIEELERAIAMAPDFAAAHLALAECWLSVVEHGAITPSVGFEKVRASSLRAARLDPALARANTLLGVVAYAFDWRWDAAETLLRRGLELDPNDPVTHGWLARYLTTQRRFDEALAEVRRVRELDPKAYSRPQLARVLNLMGHPELALEELESQLEVERDSSELYLYRGLTLLELERTDDAVRSVLIGMEMDGLEPGQSERLWNRYEKEGLQGLFRYFLEATPAEQLRLADTEPDTAPGIAADVATASYPSAMGNAELLVGAGEFEWGLDWLERAVERREPGVVTLGTYSFFDGVRDHPRFIALLERVGLP